jgi:hypothetical protein
VSPSDAIILLHHLNQHPLSLKSAYVIHPCISGVNLPLSPKILTFFLLPSLSFPPSLAPFLFFLSFFIYLFVVCVCVCVCVCVWHWGMEPWHAGQAFLQLSYISNPKIWLIARY